MKFKIFIIISLISVVTFSQEKQTRTPKELNEKHKALEKEKKELRKQIDGATLNELNFEDINGNAYTLESLKGKIVMLNFWFIQCKPCIKEFPDLNNLKMKFKGKPVEFFAVAWNDKKSLVKFLENNTLNFKVVSDIKLIDKFKIPHYPYNVIIDQEGKVEYVNDVLSFNVIKKIERKISKMLE